MRHEHRRSVAVFLRRLVGPFLPAALSYRGRGAVSFAAPGPKR